MISGWETTVAGKIVSVVIKEAHERIKTLIKEAEDNKKGKIISCISYFNATREAISGLQREHDMIMGEARFCDFGSKDEIRNLAKRIHAYLTVDLIRDEMSTAVQGLENCVRSFANDTSGFFAGFRAFRQADRLAAIEKFGNLITELRQYISDLAYRDLPHRESGTGIGARHLAEIRQALENYLWSDDRTGQDQGGDGKPPSSVVIERRQAIHAIITRSEADEATGGEDTFLKYREKTKMIEGELGILFT
jgi:hypothetical protein